MYVVGYGSPEDIPESQGHFGTSRQDLGIVMANLDNTPGTVDSHGQSHLSHGTVRSHRILMADLDITLIFMSTYCCLQQMISSL